MLKTRISLMLLAAAALLTTACDPETFGPEVTFGIRHDRSLAEYEDLAANPDVDMPDFAPVVFFSYSLDGSDVYEYVASGTLITQEWVLTAGHNFYDATEQFEVAPVSGISVTFGNDPNTSAAIYSVAEVVMHPSWLDDQQEYSDGNDLCLVRLTEPVADVTPAMLHRSGTEALGSQVYYAGFGDYSEQLDQDPDLYSKKHALENLLDRVVGGLQTTAAGATYGGGLLAFDFDDPDGFINSLGDDDITADEVILGNGDSQAEALAYEAGTVQGDSGGPLFVLNGDRWEVAGVLSGGAYDPVPGWVDGDYGDISIFTRVYTAIDWINTVIQ